MGRRRAVFAVAVLGYILSQFFRSFLTVIVDDLARDIGAGPRDLGAMGSAWFFVFALAQFPVGVLLDRLGPRRTISGMMVFIALGAGVFSFATSVAGATIAMGLIGFGCAPILMGALYFFARTESPARFAALGSLFLGVGLSGGLLASTPLAIFVAHLGWRPALLVMAGVAIVATLLIAIVMRDPPIDHGGAVQGTSLFGALGDLLRRPVLWPSLFMSIFITAEVWTERSLWIGPFFGDVYGMSAIARGHVILAFAIAMAVSASLAGPIAERWGDPKRVVMIGNIMTGLAFIALGIWTDMPALAAIILICLIGLFGVTYAVQIAHTRMFMPVHVIGRGITFVNFLSIGGTGVLQYASGIAVADMKSAGFSSAATYGALHIAFGTVLLIAAAVFAFAPSRPQQQ